MKSVAFEQWTTIKTIKNKRRKRKTKGKKEKRTKKKIWEKNEGKAINLGPIIS